MSNPESARNSPSKPETLPDKIDLELKQLEAELELTQKCVESDLHQLKRKITTYQEPASAKMLQAEIQKECDYLVNQIIHIEMNQIAESITRVTHARKVNPE